MKYGIVVEAGAWLLMGTLFSAGAVAAQRDQDRCEFGTELLAELPATQSERLSIEAGSGVLVVEGQAGVSSVTVSATACASEEWMLEEMDVVLDRRGSSIDLETDYPNDGWRNDGYARIDLRIEVPLGMEVEVDDGSGSVTLRRLGDVKIDDGSGDIYVEDILGSVEIDDGSGSMDIDGVTGSVTVDDGSGSIDIRDVGQDVIAYDIGSGTIEVSDVEGDFTVRDGRNERIRHSGVRGEVDIPAPRRRRGDRR